MNIFLDIETIPTDREDIISRIEISPPATYKKPESIAEWMKENAESAKQEAIAKMALNGGTGQVFCIGLAADGGDPVVCNGDEEDVLAAFNDAMKVGYEATRKLPFYVGHNIAWDLRFLFHRMVIHGIRPFHIPLDAPWKGSYYDTMTEWAGARDYVSLDKLCLYLGIPSPKDKMDGSQVWQYVKDGRGEEVCDYCKEDVKAVREVWKRMTFQ